MKSQLRLFHNNVGIRKKESERKDIKIFLGFVESNIEDLKIQLLPSIENSFDVLFFSENRRLPIRNMNYNPKESNLVIGNESFSIETYPKLKVKLNKLLQAFNPNQRLINFSE
jgi:hypothetical protein